MKIIRWLNLLLGGILLFACAPTPAPTEASLPEANPPAGSIMRWVDGSQVIVVDMDPTEGQVWVSQTDITYYMYSLCVDAGRCQPVYDVQLEVDYIDESDSSEDGNLSTPLSDFPISLDDATTYCEWAGGRLATEDEIARATGMSTGKRGHTTYRCAVDLPHARAPFCQTSAIYRRKISDTAQGITQNMKLEPAGQFCQNGQGYATAKLEIVGCETHIIGPNSIVSPNSLTSGDATCEMAEENKLVCYGTPGSVASGNILAGCEGNIPPVMAGRNWETCWAGQFPYPCYDDAWTSSELFCQAGYEPNPTSPASCSWAAELLDQECFKGIDAMPLAGGGYSCALTRYAEGAGSGIDPPPPASDRKCMYPMCGGVQAEPDMDPFAGETDTNPPMPPTTSVICPVGMYFDAELIACVSLGTYSDQCLDGYAYNETQQCCQSAALNAGFPGCPAGQVFDPITGTCDPNMIITAEAVLRTVEFSLDLPACEGAAGGAGGEGGSCQLTDAYCASQGGQELDAKDCKCVPVQ